MSWWAWCLLVAFAELVGLAVGWWLGHRSCDRRFSVVIRAARTASWWWMIPPGSDDWDSQKAGDAWDQLDRVLKDWEE